MSSDSSNYGREARDDGDGPPCHICGAIMVPFETTDNKKVFHCLSCGETRPR